MFEIRWRLRIGDAKLSSNFEHKVYHKIRVLIPSAKIGCHENSFGEPAKCNEIHIRSSSRTSDGPYPLSGWREGHAVNTYLAIRSGPFLITVRDRLAVPNQSSIKTVIHLRPFSSIGFDWVADRLPAILENLNQFMVMLNFTANILRSYWQPGHLIFKSGAGHRRLPPDVLFGMNSTWLAYSL